MVSSYISAAFFESVYFVKIRYGLPSGSVRGP